MSLWRVWVEGFAIGGTVVYRDTVKLRADSKREAEYLAIGICSKRDAARGDHSQLFQAQAMGVVNDVDLRNRA